MKITSKTVREFILTEKEALFVRDLLGGLTTQRVQKSVLFGNNFGAWTEKSAENAFLELTRSFRKAGFQNSTSHKKPTNT